MFTLRTILLSLLLHALSGLHAQTGELIAYVPSTPPERTADDLRITFLEPVVPGLVEVALPPGTDRVDLLNARGKVKRSHLASTVEQLDLRKLRRGTWTLRAHTSKGMVVRRFFVMGHGRVLWELPQHDRRR